MSDPIALAERAYGVAERVLNGVRPEQLDGSTPCSEWDVRALVNHLVGYHHAFAAMLSDSPMDPSAAPPDFAANDPAGSFTAGSKSLLEQWRTPGNLDKTMQLPMGPMPAAQILAMHTMDNLAHAWDLARATGQDDDLDPELATMLLAGAKQNGVPRGEYFRDEQQAPTGANAATQLAAYLGRKV